MVAELLPHPFVRAVAATFGSPAFWIESLPDLQSCDTSIHCLLQCIAQSPIGHLMVACQRDIVVAVGCGPVRYRKSRLTARDREHDDSCR